MFLDGDLNEPSISDKANLCFIRLNRKYGFSVKAISVKRSYIIVGGLLLTNYCCPECSGTGVTWDMSLKKAVCPKDSTPVSEFKLS